MWNVTQHGTINPLTINKILKGQFNPSEDNTLISNYIKILALPIINHLEDKSEQVSMTFINHNKTTRLLFMCMIHKQDMPPPILATVKRIEVQPTETESKQNMNDQTSVLNPFKPTFWTISGLEKAKTMIDAIQASKISSIKYPKFFCQGKGVVNRNNEYSNRINSR